MTQLPSGLQASLDATKVEYRQLGKSGLRVSVPILGAMSFGDPRWSSWVLTEDKALPILKAAYDRGLNTWDTANTYSAGESERIIGKAIKKYNIPRNKLVILTKCFGVVGEEPQVNAAIHQTKTALSKDYVNHQGLSRTSIIDAVDKSLERLQTNYIDLLQIHRFDDTVPIEETMRALNDVVESGKVRYIGASSMWAFQLEMMQSTAEKRGWAKFVSMQNQYSLLYREEEREMIKYCNLTGLGLIPWSPLCRGHLARPPHTSQTTVRSATEKSVSENDQKIIVRVQEIAEKRGWQMSTVALAWINKRVSSPIVGFSSLQRLEDTLEIKGKVLTDEEERYLEQLYVPKPVNGHA